MKNSGSLSIPEGGADPGQTVDLQQNDALSDSADGAADKNKVSGTESGAGSYFGTASLPPEYLDGLEDCQINVPGARNLYPGLYVSIFQNCTMSPSVDLRKQYPRGASHAVVGYKPATGELRIKILSSVRSDISKMAYKIHKDQKTIHLQGLINGYKLHDCAGKKFKADFDPEKAVVTVYLWKELQEAA